MHDVVVPHGSARAERHQTLTGFLGSRVMFSQCVAAGGWVSHATSSAARSSDNARLTVSRSRAGPSASPNTHICVTRTGTIVGGSSWSRWHSSAAVST